MKKCALIKERFIAPPMLHGYAMMIGGYGPRESSLLVVRVIAAAQL